MFYFLLSTTTREKNEQLLILKFLVTFKKSATETLNLLCEVYEEYSGIGYSPVSNWLQPCLKLVTALSEIGYSPV